MGARSLKGAVNAHLENLDFFAGEDLSGNLLVWLNKTVQPVKILLALTGVEKVKFTAHCSCCISFHCEQTVIVDLSMPIYEEDEILAGSYVFPFSLKIPNNIPGSFEYSGKETGKVEYSLETKLMSNETQISRSKTNLIIKQKFNPTFFLSNFTRELDLEIIRSCFHSNRSCLVSVCFPKNHFDGNEDITFMMTINNTDSRLSIKSVDVVLVRKIKFNHYDSRKTIKKKLAKVQEIRHVPPGAIYNTNVTFPLKSYAVSLHKKHSMYATMVSCSYFLHVVPRAKKCCICFNAPQYIDVPIIISSPNVMGPPPPPELANSTTQRSTHRMTEISSSLHGFKRS